MAENTKNMNEDLFEDTPYDEDLFEDTPYDEDLFEDVVYDEALFEEEQPSETLSTAEDIITAYGRGASWGGAPIISGAVSALTPDPTSEEAKKALEAAGISDPDVEGSTLERLLRDYREGVRVQREAQKRAEERSPKAAMAAELIGGMTSPVGGPATKLAGKAMPLKNVVMSSGKAGLVGGAITGGLESEADLTKGEIGKFAEDVSKAGSMGAIVGGGLPVTGAAAKGTYKLGKAILTSPIKVASALSDMIGRSGAGVVAKYARKGGDIQTFDKDFDMFMNEIRDTVDEKMADYGATKETIDLVATELGERVKSGEAVEEALQKIKGRFSGLGEEAAKELSKVEKEILTAVNPKFSKLQDKANKALIKAQEEGIDITQELKKVDEYPVLKESRLVGKKEPKLKTKATVMAKEGTTPKYPEGGEFTIEEAERTRKSLYDQYVAKEGVGEEAKQTAKEATLALKKAIEEARERGAGVDAKEVDNALETLINVRKKFGFANVQESSNKFLQEEKADAIRKQVLGAGDEAEQSIRRAIERLGTIDQTKSPKEAAQIATKLEELKTVYDSLTRGRRGFQKGSKVGLVEATIPRAAAEVGRQLKKKDELVQETTEVIKGSIPAQAITKTINKVAEMTPDSLKTLAQKARMKGSQAYANAIDNLSGKNEASRNAAIYGLVQQPAFRELLKEEENEVEE